ncbi:2-amino-4-hydroxy-6-hydroxymethyldihydropteridine diphosphokinase [bacterium]|nr:2-amino-4-hydroxy-6-hydroxymethyldihydropteridine diphosphokinase [bacterium]
MEHTAAIALGSNQGDRLKHLHNALIKISHIPQTSLVTQSSLYQTEPVTRDGVDNTHIPSYYNAAILIKTALKPQELLRALEIIEQDAGRTTKHDWKPRPLDLDILFYDDITLNTPKLTLPHPHLHERAFVLVPLEEIAAKWIHPVTKKTVAQMTKTVEGREGLQRLSW